MTPRTNKILFILKYRHQYAMGSPVLKSSGLFNSARFVNDMLREQGFESNFVQVIDNNGIDREVTIFRPDVVVIEALWVTPDKFEILRKLHPTVRWIVRIHSEITFLANEGVATDWLTRYLTHPNVYVAVNSKDTYKDFINYHTAQRNGFEKKILFLPNYYPVTSICKTPNFYLDPINVGCFGSLRPMKNQLLQAYAAIEYARQTGRGLRFHINSTRMDNAVNEGVLKNLRNLFSHLSDQYQLVEHGWLDHEDFKTTVGSMDLGMQLSLSETFNIVAADFVEMDIPIIASKEINWIPRIFTADPTNVSSVVRGIKRVLFIKRWVGLLQLSKWKLKQEGKRAIREWTNLLYNSGC